MKFGNLSLGNSAEGRHEENDLMAAFRFLP
jgi:hypothetical protein